MIPSIGDKGLYTVKDPFTMMISSTTSYTCIALRSIGDYILQGVDIYTTLYKAYMLSESLYMEDIKKNETIATLQSSAGTCFMIPCSYILKMPDPNGRKYRPIMMSVSLGQLPVNLKLGTLKNEVADFIYSRLGIYPEIQTIEMAEPIVLTNDQHVKNERARYQRITSYDSNAAQIKKLTEENDNLINLVNKLQDTILKLKG